MTGATGRHGGPLPARDAAGRPAWPRHAPARLHRPRGACRRLRASDEGAATAEFAVVLPAVVAMVGVLLAASRACVVQLECQDAASNVAQALAVDGSGVSVQSVAQASAGSQVQVEVERADGRVSVATACPVIADPLGILPGRVHGHAVGLDPGEE